MYVESNNHHQSMTLFLYIENGKQGGLMSFVTLYCREGSIREIRPILGQNCCLQYELSIERRPRLEPSDFVLYRRSSDNKQDVTHHIETDQLLSATLFSFHGSFC